jgi:DNA-binding ferritin-like protein
VRQRIGPLVMLCTALMPCLAGCSLFSLRLPDKPLPQRELNARMLTREFATTFAVRVEVAADGIAARSADPATQLDTLRWKLGASKASQHSATQMAPMMALLDTWAFCEQMRQFFETGAGAQLFGEDQSVARATAESLATDAQQLARGVSSDAELTRYREFVERYAREHPLADLGFARTSVVEQWTAETKQHASLVETVGSVSQSMSDVSERMRMFGERAPSQAVWETRLAMADAGFGGADLNRAFARADASLDRLSRVAESSPEQLHAAIADLRASMLVVSDRFDESWALMVATVQQEREQLAANIREEREAAVLAFDSQRAALAKDAVVVTDRAIASGGTQVRSVVRDVMLYGALLYAVILGLPFVAGYFIGRSRAAR